MLQVDEKQMDHVEAIIYSMTKAEKNKPEMINASRKNELLKELERPFKILIDY